MTVHHIKTPEIAQADEAALIDSISTYLGDDFPDDGYSPEEAKLEEKAIDFHRMLSEIAEKQDKILELIGRIVKRFM